MANRVVRAKDVLEQLPPARQAFARNDKHRGISRVVQDGEGFLAIGSLSSNLLHPVPRRFEYLLAEGADPTCLTSLLDHLVPLFAAQEGAHPIHVSISGVDKHLTAWAEADGFRPVMTTHIGVVPPRAVRSDSGAEIHRLIDRDTPEIRRALANLHAVIYRKQHQWNPPAPILPEMAEALFLSQVDLLPEYMWYSVDGQDRPIGVASLRRLRVDHAVDLGWIGVLDGSSDHTHRALLLTALSAAGSRSVTLEIDEADSQTLQALANVPVMWDSPLVRYERL